MIVIYSMNTNQTKADMTVLVWENRALMNVLKKK